MAAFLPAQRLANMPFAQTDPMRLESREILSCVAAVYGISATMIAKCKSNGGQLVPL